ncbi:MAG: hypothetical protein ABW186_17990 [Rhodanobacteraceae bacterium]
MNTKKFLMLVALGGAVVAAGCATAQQRPPVDIGDRHGNLRAAQELIQQAYERVNRAQADNGSQLGGHAARAKDLLSEASEELRLAANVSNQEGR